MLQEIRRIGENKVAIDRANPDEREEKDSHSIPGASLPKQHRSSTERSDSSEKPGGNRDTRDTKAAQQEPVALFTVPCFESNHQLIRDFRSRVWALVARKCRQSRRRSDGCTVRPSLRRRDFARFEITPDLNRKLNVYESYGSGTVFRS